MPALDGIRGVAILMVLFCHYGIIYKMTDKGSVGRSLFAAMGYGMYGVDLFFVLSGFLITGILFDSKDSASYFSTFYVRRALRIFPLYFAYLFFITVVLQRWIPVYGPAESGIPRSYWYLAYLSNWLPDFGMNDVNLGHMWTLAVEEQFYLIWPMVVFLCPRRFLGALCTVLCVGAIPFRAWMLGRGHDPEALIRLTPCRADSLVFGALLAVAIRNEKMRSLVRRLATVAVVGSIASLLALTTLDRTLSGDQQLLAKIGPFFSSVICGMIVFRAANSEGRLARLLTAGWLSKLGKYSYGIYVLHMLPQVFFYRFIYFRLESSVRGEFLFPIVNTACILGLICAAYALAGLSWRLLESPFLRLKDLFPYRDRLGGQIPKIVHTPHPQAVSKLGAE